MNQPVAKARLVLVAAFALLLVACGGSNSTSSASCGTQAGLTGKVNDRGVGTASGSSVILEASEFFFSPTCVRASAGATLTVTVKNEGTALHNFSVTSLGIDKDVPVGSTITVQVALPSSGALAFFCKYHVSSGMQGAFLVG